MIGLATRLLARDLRAGELRLMFASLVLAVASFTTVAFFADRVRLALVQEAAQLLGADLVVIADHPLDADWTDAARAGGLATTSTVRFPSMVTRPDAAVADPGATAAAADAAAQTDGTDAPVATASAAAAGPASSLLVEIKAVGDGYPLKGRLRLDDGDGVRDAHGAPAPGTVWVDARALVRLGLRGGDPLGVGTRTLRIAATLVDDPDSAVGFLNVMPRVIVAQSDLASTGLLTTGSRATWRLMLRGDRDALAAFREAAAARVAAGERVEDVRDARPEIRNALERAGRFLGLAALLSVVLAAVAVGLAARRWLQRHLDAVAVMRCLGASRRTALVLHALQLAVLGAAAGGVGAAIGYATQEALAALLAPLVEVRLPAPSPWPAVQGIAAGFVMLLGFALPPLIDLGRVPALRVLRRDLAPPRSSTGFAWAAGLAAIAALVVWQTRDPKLAGIVLGGLLGAALLGGAVALLAVRAAARVGARAGFAWRFGLSNLRRRVVGSVVQIVALATGLLALLLLAITRGDLLDAWRGTVPPDAPNRFVVNIQPDQRAPVAAFFAEQQRPVPTLFPMVRARLTAINGRKVTSSDYSEDRAKRLVDREFNLSWAAQPQVDNAIVQGHWWPPAQAASPGGASVPEFSFETGIAEAVGVRLGDRVTWDVAGTALDGAVTSLRKVDWNSFRVNFFVVAPPGSLDAYPA
ncbi:MAG: ABC transporter permease, partial [Burkholderiales bacterium]|nr:ABC transporter permease [Burkholderiales bacterium]